MEKSVNNIQNTLLISVIVPVYNGERYISQCLDCLKSQTWSNLEIIVVDDGSSDLTGEIVRRYVAADGRITLISLPENRQLYQARIAGLSKSTGDFVTTVDSDDRLSPDYMEIMLRTVLDYNAELSICDNIHTFSEDGTQGKRFTGYDAKRKYLMPYSDILAECLGFQSRPDSYDPFYTVIWNRMFSRNLLDRALPYLKEQTENILYYEDILFNMVFFYFAERTVFTKSCVYYYRRHAQSAMESTMLNNQGKNLADRIRMISFVNRFFEKVGLDHVHREEFERWMQKIARFIRYPQISTAGLKLIGQGKSGAVYEYGDGMVVKIYRNSLDGNDVAKEFTFASLLQEARIPSARAIKIIQCGKSYGIVYERLNGRSLREYLYEEPENVSLYAFLYARAVKTIHHAFPANDPGLSVRPVFDNWLREITVFTRAERNMVKMVLNSIPQRKNLLHMNPMPENLLFLTDGSLAWIDFEGGGVGHPVFALQNIYFPDLIGELPGISQTDALLLLTLRDSFLDAYFEDVPKDRFDAIERGIRFLTSLRFLHQMQTIMGNTPFFQQHASTLKKSMWQDLTMGLDYNWGAVSEE